MADGAEQTESGIVSAVTCGLVLLMLILTFVDWPSLARAPAEETGTGVAAAGKVADAPPLISKEYETATREIQMRLEHEHQLFLYQFILMGSILAIALGRLAKGTDGSSISDLAKAGDLPLLLGAAAVSLLIVDVHILYNSLIIREIGDWVRNSYEVFSSSPKPAWEHFLITEAPFHSSSFFPIVVSFLYLPTISILGAYYFLVLARGHGGETPPATFHVAVFSGVQAGLLLFALVNYWPFRYASLQATVWKAALFVSWSASWIAVGIMGVRKLYAGHQQ